MLRRSLVLATSTLLVCAIAACGEPSEESGAPPAAGDAGATDGGRDVGTGTTRSDALADGPFDSPVPGCDSAKSPSEDACVIDERLAVFVAPTGVDTAGGTKGAPLKSITKGIELGKASGKRVYVCEGTYAEQVILDASKDHTQVYGGFSCGTWAYGTTRAKVAPTVKGYALKIDGVTSAEISDVEFVAQNGTAAGESSIAAFVNASAGVVLQRVKLVAGTGVAGAAGATGSNWDPAVLPGNVAIAGKAANAANGGSAQSCDNVCTNGVKSRGGSGGDGAPVGLSPSDGQDGLPAISPSIPASATGARGTVAECSGNLGGRRGSDAPAASGGAGAASTGTLSSAGWAPASGADGMTAGPAQGGGGGGGGHDLTNGGGGGGGRGGCGGAKGTGGKGGGASVALASVVSALTLDACTLIAATAGVGGQGVGGQPGQTGGHGGAQTPGGCSGGAGGTGGHGGAGGGGAGGLSVAILHSGTAPTQSGGTTTQVAPSGAAGGAPGAGGSPIATKGKDGVAQAVLAVP